MGGDVRSRLDRAKHVAAGTAFGFALGTLVRKAPATRSSGADPVAPAAGATSPAEVTSAPKAIETPREREDDRSVTGFLTHYVIPALAAASTLGYVIVRPAFDGFYGAMGLRPEDVGYDQVQMLSLGVLMGLFYATTLAGAAVVLIAVVRLGGLAPYRGRLVISLCSLLAAALVDRGRSYGFSDSLEAGLDQLENAVRGALVLSAVALVLSPLGPTVRAWTARVVRGVGRVWVMTLAVLAVVVVALWAATIVRFAAEDNAGRILHGDYSAISDQTLTIVVASALRPVFVVPLGEDELGICGPRDDWLLTESYVLGRAGQGAHVIVFRDYDGPGQQGRVAWLPADDYAIVSGGATGCREPGSYSLDPVT